MNPFLDPVAVYARKRVLIEQLLDSGLPFDESILSKAYAHQLEAIRWLTRPLGAVQSMIPETAHGYRVEMNLPALRGFILGDDMGLGKSYSSAVAADALALEHESILVVTPVNAKLKWAQNDIPFASRALDVCVVEGKQKPEQARWIIINYDLLLKYYETLADIDLGVMLLDEAQYLKNISAQRTKMILGGLVNLPSSKAKKKPTRDRIVGLAQAPHHIFALTGTPMTHRTVDLYPLLRAIGHPLGADYMAFGGRYCGPKRIMGRIVFDGASNVAELRRLAYPVLLQRKKTDELPDFPKKTRTFMPVIADLSEYRKAMAEFRLRTLERGQSRQIKDGRPCPTLADVLPQYIPRSSFVDLLRARLSLAQATLPATIELIEQAIDSEQKTIVFSNFTEPLEAFMEKFGDAAVLVHGETRPKDREKRAERFRTDPTCKVFVGNLQAAGTAINLQSATLVIMNDLGWVATDHTQAEDRAWRIGQTLPVQVVYMVAAGTIAAHMAKSLQVRFADITHFETGAPQQMLDDLMVKLSLAPQNKAVQALDDINEVYAQKIEREAHTDRKYGDSESEEHRAA